MAMVGAKSVENAIFANNCADFSVPRDSGLRFRAACWRGSVASRAAIGDAVRTGVVRLDFGACLVVRSCPKLSDYPRRHYSARRKDCLQAVRESELHENHRE